MSHLWRLQCEAAVILLPCVCMQRRESSHAHHRAALQPHLSTRLVRTNLCGWVTTQVFWCKPCDCVTWDEKRTDFVMFLE